MELTNELIFVGVVVNRLVELAKAGLPIGEDEKWESWRTLILLLLSFVLSAAAVVFVFPSSNLFPNAASPLAGQIATGIVVGAVANGIDFVAGMGESIINRIQAKPASVVSLKASVAAEEIKAAA